MFITPWSDTFSDRGQLAEFIGRIFDTRQMVSTALSVPSAIRPEPRSCRPICSSLSGGSRNSTKGGRYGERMEREPLGGLGTLPSMGSRGKAPGQGALQNKNNLDTQLIRLIFVYHSVER